MLITTTEQLSSFCASLSGDDFVAVDTEFMRERTFYSKLCLVQLAGSKHAVAIDPLSEDIDLTPLYALMDNPKIVKVFHAARQDVEIFVDATGRVPAPLFDTQVAAMVCGFGEAASYETLADKLAGAKIDKSSRFTDWSARPLTERQTTYALADVTHLRIVYEKLREKLSVSNRGKWVDEEMKVLTNLPTYQVEPYEIWKRLKLRADKPRLRALLRELAAWRELEAQKLNVPRGRVLKDEALAEIANHAPANTQELSRTRGMHAGFAESRQGTEILAAVARVKDLPINQCPEGEPRRSIPNGSAAVLDMLKVLLRQVSDEHGVAAKLIATTDDLEAIAAEDTPDVKTLSGWRKELFGDVAMSLKNGKKAIAVRNHKIVLIDL